MGSERDCLVDESLRAFFVDGVVGLLEHDAARTNKKTEVPDSAAAEVVATLLLTALIS